MGVSAACQFFVFQIVFYVFAFFYVSSAFCTFFFAFFFVFSVAVFSVAFAFSFGVASSFVFVAVVHAMKPFVVGVALGTNADFCIFSPFPF